MGYRVFVVEDDRSEKYYFLRDRLFDGLSLIVVSPGVLTDSDIIKKAKDKNIKEYHIHFPEDMKTGDKKYPVVFNINVMEEIQEAYGSISKWGAIVENAEGGEPKVKDLKVGLMYMINEAIDIENEDKGENKSMLTLKQVGRLISDVGFEVITTVIKNISVASTNTGDNEGKNE